MIPPAQMRPAQRDVVQRMVEIGRPDAERIERKADTRRAPQRMDQQPRRARQFGHAGQRDDARRRDGERYSSRSRKGEVREAQEPNARRDGSSAE